MEETKNGKSSNLSIVAQRLENLPEETLIDKYNKIEHKLFEFANFMEAQLAFQIIYAQSYCTYR